MERSHLVHMLKLPIDTIDCICSFLFYTLQQSIERNKKKYKKLFNDIQQIEISHIKMYYRLGGSFMYFMIIQYPIKEHKVVYTNLCNDCGNFIHVSNPYKCFGCRCYIKI
jgi:hypothetical protein